MTRRSRNAERSAAGGAGASMAAAVVRLPYDVVRGWEWVWPTVLAVMFSVAAWAHVTGRFVLKTKVAKTPLPDWPVVVTAVIAVGWLIWMIVSRMRERAKARAWVREIGPSAEGLPLGGVAGVCAQRLAMDAEGVGCVRFEQLERFERESGQKLPRLWVDAEATGQVLGSGGRGLLRYPLRGSRRRWLAVVGPTVAVFAVMPAAMLAAQVVYPQRSLSPLVVALFLAPVAVGLVVLGLWVTTPRAQLVVMPGRVVVMRGKREQRVNGENAFVIAVRRRAKTKRGYQLLEGVRWWVLLRGWGPMYCDDVGLRDTPWADEMAWAVERDGEGYEVGSAAPGVCPACGYSTVGLQAGRCPECGGPVEPVQAGSR